MAESLINLFGTPWIYLFLFFITGVLVSVFVEAINLILLKAGIDVHPWWLVAIVSIPADVLMISVFSVLMVNLSEIILVFVVNFFFPILFYYLAGTFTVDLIFKKFRQKAESSFTDKTGLIR